MSTHNICFYREIIKVLTKIATLFKSFVCMVYFIPTIVHCIREGTGSFHAASFFLCCFFFFLVFFFFCCCTFLFTGASTLFVQYE